MDECAWVWERGWRPSADTGGAEGKDAADGRHRTGSPAKYRRHARLAAGIANAGDDG